jgi:hypothetical protein
MTAIVIDLMLSLSLNPFSHAASPPLSPATLHLSFAGEIGIRTMRIQWLLYDGAET